MSENLINRVRRGHRQRIPDQTIDCPDRIAHRNIARLATSVAIARNPNKKVTDLSAEERKLMLGRWKGVVSKLENAVTQL